MTLSAENIIDAERRYRAMQIVEGRGDLILKSPASSKAYAKNRSRYGEVSVRVREEHGYLVPPWFISALHWAECNGSMIQHLHNGDLLIGPTVNVPKGRPKGVTFPCKWEDSAVDALSLHQSMWRWAESRRWAIGVALLVAEAYNGLGYSKRNMPSSYVWSGTSLREKGRFIADGEFDPEARDQRCGLAVVLALYARDGLAALPLPKAMMGRRVLARGSRGEAVRNLQASLALLSYIPSSGIDGEFGAKTETAIKHFQEATSLPPGIVSGIACGVTQDYLSAKVAEKDGTR